MNPSTIKVRSIAKSRKPSCPLLFPLRTQSSISLLAGSTYSDLPATAVLYNDKNYDSKSYRHRSVGIKTHSTISGTPASIKNLRRAD